ncbi:MAG: glycosyltransferase family 2 protein [Rhodanobacter sp.]
MRISVVVITYNWPDALHRVLQALARQTELPYEVIVTDDGSRVETRQVLERLANDYPTRLLHVWQPDDGARMSRARNRGILAARGEYVVLLDGDMVCDRHFIADQRKFAQAGCFVQGSRVLTDAAATQRLLASQAMEVNFFSSGIERRRNALRWPWLARLKARPSRSARGIKSCNMGFWRTDLLRLNGFNEAMTGWGREDTELVARAFHAGLRRRDVRFSALAVHLFHPTRKHLVDNPNDRILEDTRARQLIRCEQGLDRHRAEFAQAPVDLRVTVRAGSGVEQLTQG